MHANLQICIVEYNRLIIDVFLKIKRHLTLRGGGGKGHDANFSMNFEPSFLIMALSSCLHVATHDVI